MAEPKRMRVRGTRHGPSYPRACDKLKWPQSHVHWLVRAKTDAVCSPWALPERPEARGVLWAWLHWKVVLETECNHKKMH